MCNLTLLRFGLTELIKSCEKVIGSLPQFIGWNIQCVMASNLASICQPGSRIVLCDQYIDTWGAGKSYRVIHQENIQGGPPGEYTGWSTWRIYRVIHLIWKMPFKIHIYFTGFYFWKNSKRPWNCSIFVRSLFLLLALTLPTLFRLKLPNTVAGRWDI